DGWIGERRAGVSRLRGLGEPGGVGGWIARGAERGAGGRGADRAAERGVADGVGPVGHSRSHPGAVRRGVGPRLRGPFGTRRLSGRRPGGAFDRPLALPSRRV
ncbi:MAG: hypothetical protein AVDCRST_MAG89-5437, partial [uncultured Gemmatimonadetes bacterium]